MARKLIVEIVGDSSSLEKAFGSASKSGSSFSRNLIRVGKAAAVGVGAAFVGMAAVVKVGFDEIAEGQKVAAQTAAVLKSTGGVANVTAKEVANLATEQSKLTGIDDELIQSSENLLLTFKNVRDEVGKGNNVFERATKSALDLSTAGFGSVESASKMMGKALNDPIKGMTALGRAGVTFSEDQKKAIKSLVDTGDLLGAQKIILKEVESQVGGSAKAYGETLPGQLSKLKNAFEEAAAGVAQALLPALTRLVEIAVDLIPVLAEWGRKIGEAVGPSVTAAVEGIIPLFQRVKQSIIDLANAARSILPTLQAIGGAAFGAAMSSAGQAVIVATAAMYAFRTAVTAVTAQLAALRAAAAGAGIASLISPLGLATAAVGLMTAAFVYSRGASDALKGSLDAQRASLEALQDAARESTNSQDRLRDSKIAVRQATLDVSAAVRARNQLEAQGKRGTDEYTQAQVRVQQAYSSRIRAEHEVSAAQEGVTKSSKNQSSAIQTLNKDAEFLRGRMESGTSALGRFGNEAAKHRLVTAYATEMQKMARQADKLADANAKSNPKLAEAAEKFADNARAASNYAKRTGEIPPALGKVGPQAQAAGKNVGTSFGQGLAAGIGSQISSIAAAAARSVTAAENAARAAAQAKSPSKTWQKLGEDMQQGLIIGFITRGTTFSQMAASHLSTSLQSARTEFLAASKILGAGAAQKIVDGFRSQDQSLAQQIKTALRTATTEAIKAAAQAVTDARGTLTSAFQSVANDALSAFDAVVGAWKPPALIKLEARQLERQKQDLIDAITKAGEDVKAARDAFTEAVAGGDPEKVKTAQAALVQAQKAQADALAAQQDFSDQQLAAKQQIAHDKRMAQRRVHLQAELAEVQTWLQKHPGQYEEAQRRINAILKQHGVDAKFWGTAVGIALADGMKASNRAVAAAAEALATAIAKKLKLRSNAEEGPLSDLDSWFRGLVPTLTKGIDYGAAARAGADVATSFRGGLTSGAGEVVGTLVPPDFRESLSGAFTAVTPTTATPTVEAFAAVSESVTEASGVVTVFRDLIVSLPVVAATAFGTLLSTVIKLTKSLPTVLAAPTAALQGVADAISAIGAAAYSARSALQDTVDDILRLRARVGNLNEGIPGRQHGGSVRARHPYIVGEAGPELFIPSSAGTIRTAGAGTSAIGGTTVVLNFHGPTVGTSRDFEDAVRRAIYDVNRRNPVLAI